MWPFSPVPVFDAAAMKFIRNQMGEFYCTVYIILCSSLFLSAVPAEKDCRTSVEILPSEATTLPGAEPDEPLHVTCFTQRFPSPASQLLSLTAGFLGPSETGAKSQNRNQGQITESNLRDSFLASSSQGFSGDTDTDSLESQGGAQDNANSTKRGDGKVFRARDMRKTMIAQLVPHENSNDHDGIKDLYRHVKVSSAFQHRNVTARIEFADTRLGLVLVLKKASITCSSPPSFFFYCSAIACERDTINSKKKNHHNKHRATVCHSMLKETVISRPFFVQGCESEVFLSETETYPNTICTKSTNFTDMDKGKIGTKLRENRIPDGDGNTIQYSSANEITDHRRFFRQKTDDIEQNGERVTEEEAQKRERLSAYMIMSISFAGGFIVGASLGGVCWCMRTADTD